VKADLHMIIQVYNEMTG